jgi:hypothetical protein
MIYYVFVGTDVPVQRDIVYEEFVVVAKNVRMVSLWGTLREQTVQENIRSGIAVLSEEQKFYSLQNLWAKRISLWRIIRHSRKYLKPFLCCLLAGKIVIVTQELLDQAYQTHRSLWEVRRKSTKI